jgi:multidrug efflux pump subunit AcrB
MKFLESLIRNHPLANVTFVLVLVFGFVAYNAMPRERDPEINFNWVIVTTALPGASAEDVERRVTQPLEDAIKGVADIKFVASNSREGIASMLIRFTDISERVFDKRVNDLRREIQNRANLELPSESKEPRILEITTSNGFPTAMVLVTGAADDEYLRRAAKNLRDDLERMPGVDRVYANGLNDPELRVEFLPQAAQARGVTAADIADSVGAWFRDTFAGKARVGEDEWLVRLVGQEVDPAYLARLSVAPALDPQRKVPLDAVATAERTRVKPDRLAASAGRPAVVLSVTKKSRINTVELVDRINRHLAEQGPALARSGVSAMLMDDQTVPTREAIGVMETNALIGLLVVIGISWLFLGTRVSLLVGLGIPFSLAGTFGLLHAFGFTLNISVLLGIVIALGMLVDDAVVVVEAIYYRIQRGEEYLDAAFGALREVISPVTSAVATTMSAFLPLMLLPGIVGKFMFVIPFVVTLALTISLIEAYWMLPTHIGVLRLNFDAPTRMQRWRTRFTHTLRVKYARLLISAMRRPKLWLAVAAGMLALAATAMATGVVRVQFFALDPLRIFYVNVDMPAGAPVDATLAKVQAVEARVRQQLRPDEARELASVAGIKFTDTEPLYGDAYGQVFVSLNPAGAAARAVPELIEAMRAEVEATPGPGKVTFTILSGGPPLTRPVRVRVRGDDQQALRTAADAVLEIVRGIPGARDVADDEVPGRPELVLALDREAVRTAGLNPAQVARIVRLHVDGEIVALARDRGEKVEVRVRAKREGTADIASILSDPVALPGGGSTTLGALVQAQTRTGPGIVKHYNLKRAITVEADLDKALTDTVAANRIIEEAWKKVQADHPGVSLDFSGEMDDIQESLDAMAVLFLVGIGLIYMILAAQFKSYWQPLMILVTVPLAFTGVALGLVVSRDPLSLYTMYGVIALTGIAVNSAIVLIAAANDRMRSGMGALHAAVYAARRRVVPIIITSVTTIGGLFSLAFGLAGESMLWGPVAGAIVWGLGFATVLTLFVIPLLYWLSMRPRAPRRGGRLLRLSPGTQS